MGSGNASDSTIRTDAPPSSCYTANAAAPRGHTGGTVAGPRCGRRPSRGATSLLLRPSSTTAVITSCAFDMAGLPRQQRCQLCRGTAANYVLKPDTVTPTKEPSEQLGEVPYRYRLAVPVGVPTQPTYGIARHWGIDRSRPRDGTRHLDRRPPCRARFARRRYPVARPSCQTIQERRKVVDNQVGLNGKCFQRKLIGANQCLQAGWSAGNRVASAAMPTVGILKVITHPRQGMPALLFGDLLRAAAT